VSSPFVPTQTEDALLGEIVAFVQSVIFDAVPTDVPVVRGQVNRVPEPPGGSLGFVAVVPGAGALRLATNETSYNDPGGSTGGTETLSQSTRYEALLHCYGPQAADWAASLSILLRSEYAVEQLALSTPLHADDPIQVPLANGEEQWEQHWQVRALVQYRPAAVAPMQFADTMTPPIIYTPVT
jgi:hypothetical protein